MDLVHVVFCYRVTNQKDYVAQIEELKMEICMWKQKCHELEQKNEYLEKQVKKKKEDILADTTLQRCFTPGQIRLLLNPSIKIIR